MGNTDLEYFTKKINKDLILRLVYATNEDIRKTCEILVYFDCLTGEKKKKAEQKRNMIVEYFINSNFNNNYKDLMFNLFHENEKTLLSDSLDEILELFLKLGCNKYASNFISSREDTDEIIKGLNNMRLMTVEELFETCDDVDRINEIITDNKLKKFDQDTNIYVYVPDKNNK